MRFRLSQKNSLQSISSSVMMGLSIILKTTSKVLSKAQQRVMTQVLKDITLWDRSLTKEKREILLPQNYQRLVEDAQQFLNRARFGAKEPEETSADITVYLTLVFKIFNLLASGNFENKDLNQDARALAYNLKRISKSFTSLMDKKLES